MFTPRWITVGDLVKINKDISNEEGTYGAGHEFRVIDIHYRGDDVFYDLRDHHQHLLGQVPLTDLIPENAEE
jgi:hypothetical protein